MNVCVCEREKEHAKPHDEYDVSVVYFFPDLYVIMYMNLNRFVCVYVQSVSVKKEERAQVS